MHTHRLRAPVAAIALTGLVSVASALCLVSSNLPAADAALAEMILTPSNADPRTLPPWHWTVLRWLGSMHAPARH